MQRKSYITTKAFEGASYYVLYNYKSEMMLEIRTHLAVEGRTDLQIEHTFI